jgi:hypothetical protein
VDYERQENPICSTCGRIVKCELSLPRFGCSEMIPGGGKSKWWDAVKKDVTNYLHKTLDAIPPEELVDFAVDDVIESSALAEGGEEWSDGDIVLGCQRALRQHIAEALGFDLWEDLEAERLYR